MGGPDHERWSNGHPTGGPTSTYSTMNHARANYISQARYTSNMRYDELPHPITVRCWITVYLRPPLFMVASSKVPVGLRGNQTHNGGYPTASGTSQYTLIGPGLPRLDYRAPATPVSATSPSSCV